MDLTPFFCDQRSCYPVVGGVLVHKDINHLTRHFAETLGPYLLRAVVGSYCLASHWPGAADGARADAAALADRGAGGRLGAATPANGCAEPETVVPATGRSAPCERTEPLGLVKPCVFGPAGGETFALIGDSHADALRSAFALAAEGWAGVASRSRATAARTSAKAAPLPEPTFSQCVTFKQQVPQWLAQHPEVTTVFVVGLPRNAGAQDPAGLARAWKTFPPSVERLVVVRDTPEQREDMMACVEGQCWRPVPGRVATARPALPPDPAVAAAGRPVRR